MDPEMNSLPDSMPGGQGYPPQGSPMDPADHPATSVPDATNPQWGAPSPAPASKKVVIKGKKKKK